MQIKFTFPYLLLAILCVALFFTPDSWQHALEYNRQQLAHGDLWRLVTGHLLHSNFYHLLMNLTGILLLMLLHAHLPGRVALGYQVLALGLLTGVGLWVGAPDTERYVGLSGVLHGMLCFGAVYDIKQAYHSGYLILTGVALKLSIEHYQGPDVILSQQIGAVVAIEAHLLGACAGIVLALLFIRMRDR